MEILLVQHAEIIKSEGWKKDILDSSGMEYVIGQFFGVFYLFNRVIYVHILLRSVGQGVL